MLLSHALLDLTRRSEAAGATEVVLWSNFLRVVEDGGVDRSELPPLTRLSKRAARTTLNVMVRREWAVLDGDVVHLSEPARLARNQWGAAIRQAEAGWPGTGSLRAALEATVAALPLEHPHYPCGYGTADWRITGGPGVDWKPVPRDLAADTVSAVPLLALLSQALVGFAVEYERRVPFALVVGVYFDAVFGDGSLPLAAVPRALTVTGNGKSSLERHGALTADPSGLVTLTPYGRRLRDAYRPTVDAIEASWPSAGPLRVALEKLDVHGGAHADHPDVRHLGAGFGFAEVSARP